MEYYIARSLDVCRLSPDQIDLLHLREKVRCLMPYEIKLLFGLEEAKQFFSIPFDDLTAQASHIQRLRGDFDRIGIKPKHPLNSLDINEVHKFDATISDAYASGEFQPGYSGASRRKRMTDEF